MNKFLYFANSTTDAGAIPVSLLREIQISASSDLLRFKFKDVGDGIGQEISISCSTTEDKADKVVSSIANEIAFGTNPFIVIADEINNEFIHSDLLSVDTNISLT